MPPGPLTGLSPPGRLSLAPGAGGAGVHRAAGLQPEGAAGLHPAEKPALLHRGEVRPAGRNAAEEKVRGSWRPSSWRVSRCPPSSPARERGQGQGTAARAIALGDTRCPQWGRCYRLYPCCGATGRVHTGSNPGKGAVRTPGRGSAPSLTHSLGEEQRPGGLVPPHPPSMWETVGGCWKAPGCRDTTACEGRTGARGRVLVGSRRQGWQRLVVPAVPASGCPVFCVPCFAAAQCKFILFCVAAHVTSSPSASTFRAE